jgi:hypothetical protein
MMIPAQRKVVAPLFCTASQAGRNGEGNGTCRAALVTRFAACLAEHLTHRYLVRETPGHALASVVARTATLADRGG